MLGRWPGAGGCRERQGAVRGYQEGHVKLRNGGSPGHPEVHLNSPAKDPPSSVSEVASLSRRGLDGGQKGVQRLGMRKAKGG